MIDTNMTIVKGLYNTKLLYGEPQNNMGSTGYGLYYSCLDVSATVDIVPYLFTVDVAGGR